MVNNSEEFLQKFYTLEGLTIAHRRKNFFKLLHQNANLLNQKETLDNITTNLTPRTYLETLFRVDFLIYFRRSKELFEILKEGNDIFVSKIIKQIWFFEELNDIPPDELVNEILPCLSYTVRMKVLRKLSRYLDDKKFGEIFDNLINRYGIYLATQFITGCSSEKIEKILNLYPLKLTSTQLRILHGKNRNLIEIYFSKPNNKLNNHNYKHFVKFLYHNDRVLFDTLQQTHHVIFILGRRATKKIFDNKRTEIIETPHKFNYINMKVVIRKLGKDSVKLFTNFLPEEIRKCMSLGFINHFPKRYHYNLFIKILPAHYNVKLEDHYYLINETLLNLIIDNNERASLAKIRVNRGDDNYIKYLCVNESISVLKEKINLTSDIQERSNLLGQLIETCYINNDLDALFSVMKYFNFRHKNDELQVHLNFIYNIEKLFTFQKFTEEMWNCLNELLMIHMLKFDHREITNKKIQTLPLLNINVGTSTAQKLSYLEFLFKRGISIDDLLTDYFNSHIVFPDYGKYDEKFEKYMLSFALNSPNKNDNFKCNLINQILKWNQIYEDQLNFYDYPELIDTFKKIIQTQKEYNHFDNLIINHFRQKIFTTQENKYRKEYLEIYWKFRSRYLSFVDINWFLKFDPLSIANNLDIVLDFYTENNINTFRLREWLHFKQYNHLEFDKFAIQKYLTKLNDETCLENKEKFIPFLSILMKPEDFMLLAETYKPENKKLDLNNEKQVRLYNLQCCIAANIKNTKTYQSLSILLFYCIGDYFKFAMRSLYSLMYRTPENLLSDYLNFLSTQAVSVRKHSLFLTCELSTLREVEKIITVLNQQEKVKSLQKYLFAATIQYFVKNPNEEFFKLVKMNMLFVEKTDEESLQSIIKHLKKIPETFKADYIVNAWRHLEKTVDIWAKLKPLKRQLLHQMTLTICSEICLEFGLEIIDKHFWLEDQTYDLSKVSDFDFIFLKARNEKSVIFEKLFTKKQSSQDYFLQHWYQLVMKLKNEDVSYLEPFVNHYQQHVSLVDNFHGFVKLFFLKTKLKFSGMVSVEEFLMDLLFFFDEIIEKCGFFIISLFAKRVKLEIHYFFEEIDVMKLCCDIIKKRPEPNAAMLIMTLLSGARLETFMKRKMAFRKEIIDEISKIDDIGVQIYLKNDFYLYSNEIKNDSSHMDYYFERAL